MGARLAWYGSTAAPSSPDAPTPITDAAVVELLDGLTRADEAITPAAFLADAGDRLRSPASTAGGSTTRASADLSRGLDQPVTHGLIYAGLAGATRSRSGRKSKNTLWGRIKSMHLGGRHEFSTFRLSLGSILAEARGDIDIDEEAPDCVDARASTPRGRPGRGR